MIETLPTSETIRYYLLPLTIRILVGIAIWKLVKRVISVLDSILDVLEDERLEFEDNETDEDCPICVEKLKWGVQTKCGHKFCYECIVQWMTTCVSTCPTCRRPIVKVQKYNWRKSKHLWKHVALVSHKEFFRYYYWEPTGDTFLQALKKFWVRLPLVIVFSIIVSLSLEYCFDVVYEFIISQYILYVEGESEPRPDFHKYDLSIVGQIVQQFILGSLVRFQRNHPERYIENNIDQLI